jgi:hypothetical protein
VSSRSTTSNVSYVPASKSPAWWTSIRPGPACSSSSLRSGISRPLGSWISTGRPSTTTSTPASDCVTKIRAGPAAVLGRSTKARSGSCRRTSGCGFGWGAITTSATSPTLSAAEPGRTAAKLSTVSR